MPQAVVQGGTEEMGTRVARGAERAEGIIADAFGVDL